MKSKVYRNHNIVFILCQLQFNYFFNYKINEMCNKISINVTINTVKQWHMQQNILTATKCMRVN